MEFARGREELSIHDVCGYYIKLYNKLYVKSWIKNYDSVSHVSKFRVNNIFAFSRLSKNRESLISQKRFLLYTFFSQVIYCMMQYLKNPWYKKKFIYYLLHLEAIF